MKNICKVCGKEFNGNTGVVTCEDCRGTVLKQRTFGIKKCVWCGKEFVARSPRQESCGDVHYRPCIDCGKLIEVKASYHNYIKYGGRRCLECRAKAISKSKKAASNTKKADIRKKSIATSRIKYGTDYPMQSDIIKDRAISTLRKKYGVTNISQSPEIRAKIDETVGSKYGGYTFASPILRKQVDQTMIDLYGDKVPLRVDSIAEKQHQTNLSRYGVINVGQSKEIQDRMKSTSLKRYGVEYPMQCKEVHDRCVQTNLAKYGAKMYPISKEAMLDVISDPSKIDRYMEFRSDPKSYILQNFDHRPTLHEIASDVGITETSVSDTIIRTQNKDLIHYYISSMEQDIVNYIKMLDSNIVVEMHNRKLISPLEIDIYLPDFKIGIECNPTYTHNSSFSTIWDSIILQPCYHKQKSEMCEKAGIRLIHIFGYQWNNHPDIIKSMLRNILKLNENRMYARNLNIKEVDFNQATSFLNQNHIQGYTSSKVRIGLYDGDELISIMTFSHPRYTLGFHKEYDADTWELTRFCTKLNTTCVGGASKLFKYFLKNYHPSKVISFSDRSNTSGNVYSILGFEFDSYVDPGYVWVNLRTDVAYNRVMCQKRNLPKLFNEDIDIENKTESQIMEDHGFAKVYNSGLIKWIYRSK